MTALEVLEGLGARGVLEAIAREYGTTPAAVLGKSMRPRIAGARTRLYFVLLGTLGVSQVELGEIVGRDRSSICSAVSKEERLAAERLGLR